MSIILFAAGYAWMWFDWEQNERPRLLSSVLQTAILVLAISASPSPQWYVSFVVISCFAVAGNKQRDHHHASFIFGSIVALITTGGIVIYDVIWGFGYSVAPSLIGIIVGGVAFLMTIRTPVNDDDGLMTNDTPQSRINNVNKINDGSNGIGSRTKEKLKNTFTRDTSKQQTEKQRVRENQTTSDAETDQKVQKDTQGGENEDEEDQSEVDFAWEDPPDIQFSDIGGYESVKKELHEEVIDPYRNQDGSYERFNVEPTKGMLFHGPPGTGKTLFSRALANKLDKEFVELSQADLTHQFINRSPTIISSLFEQAEEKAAVVFIDEAEQLLGERGGMNTHNEDSKITTTFLNALSQEEQNFILVLTTNRRDQMDEAILRPGRIDSEFNIGLPNENARREILSIELEDVPMSISIEKINELIKKTSGWSGADLSSMINRAKLLAAHENATTLKERHLDKAYLRLKEDIEQ